MTSPHSPLRRSIVLGSAMALVSVGSTLAMPKPQVTSESQIPDLEALLPSKFGRWVIDGSIVPLTVSPDVAQMLATLYDRTVSRTYVNDAGERVMLSVAYGTNQSRALQLHKPEVCYVSQGFRLADLRPGQWSAGGFTIPTMHMVTSMGPRVEPVTYWLRIGDDIARGWFEQNKVRLKYGTRGLIPDGVLFRVSSIGGDPAKGFELQRRFVDEMIKEMNPVARKLILGNVVLGLAS